MTGSTAAPLAAVLRSACAAVALSLAGALAAPTPARAAEGATYVLVVGVNAYEDARIPALRFAEADAREVYKFYATEKRSPSSRDRVTLLLGADATRKGILKAIRERLAQFAIGPADTAILYFAGHGFADQRMTYLAPQDTELAALAETAISATQLSDAWGAVVAGRKVLIMDACHSGGIQGVRGIGGVVQAPLANAAASAARSVVISSTGPSELSTEDGDLGQGCFTLALVKGLRGEADLDEDGFVTDAELARFLALEVPKLAAEAGGKQTPQVQRGEGGATDAIVLARAPDTKGAPKAERTTSPVEAGKDAPSSPPGTVAAIEGQGWSGEALPAGMQVGKEKASYLWDTGTGLRIEMVYIPPGPFIMGGDEDTGLDNERPRHKHAMPDGYYVGKHETTWREFRAFCQATNRAAPTAPAWAAEDHPVVNVSWDDARAYCKWAGLRLPTEPQWEKAARGTLGIEFPFGKDWSAERCNHGTADGRGDPGDGWEHTAPVGSFPSGVSPFGAHDMAGNVSEWCGDWYVEGAMGYARYVRGDMTSPKTGRFRVYRGGGWEAGPAACRAALRSRRGASFRDEYLGFRPVWAAED